MQELDRYHEAQKVFHAHPPRKLRPIRPARVEVGRRRDRCPAKFTTLNTTFLVFNKAFTHCGMYIHPDL